MVKIICTHSEYPKYQTEGKIYEAEYNKELDLYLITNDVGKQHYVYLNGTLFTFKLYSEESVYV